MGMLKEFKDFAVKGNAVDIAVGIIIGAAFGKIVSTLVGEVLMPPLGKLMGNVDFSNMFFSLDQAKTEGINSLAKAKETGAAIIAYGAFANTVIDFIIVAFCIFLVVKLMNKLKGPAPEAVPTTRDCPRCLSVVSIKATRCAHCTSDLPQAEPASSAAPAPIPA